MGGQVGPNHQRTFGKMTPHRDCRYFLGLVQQDAISCAEFDERGEAEIEAFAGWS